MESIQDGVTGRKPNAASPAPNVWAHTVREFCEGAKISPSTFWKYVGLGKINIVKIGGRTLVTETERRRLLKETA